MKRDEIILFCSNKYNITPLYPWKLNPDHIVLRHEKSKKWFALFMRVCGDKIRRNPEEKYDIVNVFVGKGFDEKMIDNKDVFPAINMNKNEWMAILIDGNIFDSAILDCIDRSYQKTAESIDISDAYGIKEVFDLPKLNSNFQNEDINVTSGYKEEKLSFGSKNKFADTPKKIFELRKIYYDAFTDYDKDNHIFYKQAKLMENFDDDFSYKYDFARAYPNYNMMSNNQLRSYFTWRKEVRKRVFDHSCTSYLYLYIYETLCGIGINNSEDGYDILIFLRDEYKDDSKIFSDLNSFIKDYIIYYNLDVSKLTDVFNVKAIDNLNYEELIKFEDEIIFLLNKKTSSKKADKLDDMIISFVYDIDENVINNIFKLLCDSSKYDLSTSVFYKENKEKTIYSTIFLYILLFIEKYKDSQIKLSSIIVGDMEEMPYRIFTHAVFYDSKKYSSYEYKVNDNLIYICKNARWSVKRFYLNNKTSSEFGKVLKELDRQMRREFHFKTHLKQVITNTRTLNSISKCINLYKAYENKSKLASIKLNMNSLSKIRKDAAITRDKILTSEEIDDFCISNVTGEQTQIIELSDNKQIDTAKTKCTIISENKQIYISKTKSDISDKAGIKDTTDDALDEATNLGLNNHQLYILKALLEGRDIKDYIKKNKLMLSILIDDINEKFYDIVYDNIIDMDEDRPFILEDYYSDVRKYI